jgi:hypothetical protein
VRAFVHGGIGRPAAAVVGTWDPFVPAHRVLFRQLSEHAAAVGLDAVAILLDPSPVLLLHGRSVYPVYDDIGSRLPLMLESDVDGVVRVAFARRDLGGTPGDLLRAVDATGVRIAELWLGRRQSLGTGDEGSREGVAQLAKRRGMRLEILPHVREPSMFARGLLKEGKLAEAAELVGHFPLRRRPRGDSLLVAWPPGRYLALPLAAPAAAPTRPAVEVDLVPGRGGMAALEWPDPAFRYLTFVAGPGDASPRGETRTSASAVAVPDGQLLPA